MIILRTLEHLHIDTFTLDSLGPRSKYEKLMQNQLATLLSGYEGTDADARLWSTIAEQSFINLFEEEKICWNNIIMVVKYSPIIIFYYCMCI